MLFGSGDGAFGVSRVGGKRRVVAWSGSGGKGGGGNGGMPLARLDYARVASAFVDLEHRCTRHPQIHQKRKARKHTPYSPYSPHSPHFKPTARKRRRPARLTFDSAVAADGRRIAGRV